MSLKNDYTKDPLLSASEVARMFRVDRKTVTQWAKSGRLKGIKTPGGSLAPWRFRKSDVETLMRAEVCY